MNVLLPITNPPPAPFSGRPRPHCAQASGPILGIVGGGQLARMLAQGAAQLGCASVVLERGCDIPAASVSMQTIVGDGNDPRALAQLGWQVDAVTLENEFVDADSLVALEQSGVPLWPASSTVRVIQDKLRQREALAAANLPVPHFAAAPDKASVATLGASLGWPLLLKKRRNGYDGRGNVTLRSAAEIDAAWQRLAGDASPLYAEEFCAFSMEIAVILCRGRDGSVVTYPVVETIQQNHVCHIVKAPAVISEDAAGRAIEIARRAVEAVDGVGCFGVELFYMPDARIVINELAPRVHNSGHYTIEACACSQFENHVRAGLGWPLGAATMRAPAAVMLNLLGSCAGSGQPHGIEQALAVPGAHVHVYGKNRSAAGRKMGHVTALGNTVEEALATARRAATVIHFGDRL